MSWWNDRYRELMLAAMCVELLFLLIIVVLEAMLVWHTFYGS